MSESTGLGAFCLRHFGSSLSSSCSSNASNALAGAARVLAWERAARAWLSAAAGFAELCDTEAGGEETAGEPPSSRPGSWMMKKDVDAVCGVRRDVRELADRRLSAWRLAIDRLQLCWRLVGVVHQQFHSEIHSLPLPNSNDPSASTTGGKQTWLLCLWGYRSLSTERLSRPWCRDAGPWCSRGPAGTSQSHI